MEFLGVWEQIHNPNFKVVEFDHFKSQAGLPSFVISVSEWVNKTNAIGLIVRKGKYGANGEIATQFFKVTFATLRIGYSANDCIAKFEISGFT